MVPYLMFASLPEQDSCKQKQRPYNQYPIKSLSSRIINIFE